MSDTNGRTTNEVARLLRVGQAKVLAWIRSGKLRAIDTSTKGKPRFIVLPADLEKFIAGRTAVPTTAKAPRRKRRQPALTDYYPD
jgi:excisionase family DNA binding protein